MKFHNLGDKTFETDFNTDIYSQVFAIYQGKFALCKLDVKLF